MNRFFLALGACLVVALMATPSFALTVSPDVYLKTAADVTSNSLRSGQFQSNTEIALFYEGKFDVSDIWVDVTEDGTYNQYGQLLSAAPAGGVYPRTQGAMVSGKVESYLIHFDNISGVLRLAGEILFDSNILGLQVFDSRLLGGRFLPGTLHGLNGHDLFGTQEMAGIAYTNNTLTDQGGLELNESPASGDEVVLMLAGNSLQVNLGTTDGLDQIRILVESPVVDPEPQPIPEPGTLLLLGTGLIGLVGYGRRRKQQ